MKYFGALVRLMFIPEGAAGGGVAPPPEKPADKTRAEIKAEKAQKKLEKQVQQVQLHQTVAALNSKISELEKKLSTQQPVIVPDPKADGDKKTVQQQLDALHAEIKKRDEQIAAEKRTNAINTAVGKVPFLNAQLVTLDISQRLKVRDDGSLFVPGIEQIGSVAATKEWTIDEAVQAFAKSNPFLVKADVKAGSGASGGGGAGGSSGGGTGKLRDQITKFKQVIDNPALLAQLQAEDPEYAAQLENKYFEKQRAKMSKKRI